MAYPATMTALARWKCGFAVAIEVVNARDAAVVAELDREMPWSSRGFLRRWRGIRNVSDERAGFCADLAALNAVAAIDAVRTVGMRAGEDRDRPADGDGDAERGAAFDERVADAAHGVRAVGIAVRMAPGKIGRTGDGHLEFELFVVGTQSLVGNGPVGADAIARVDLEVRRMKAGSEGGPVDRAAADAFAAIVGAEGEWIGAAGDAEIFPVELVRAGFVADPVAFGIPEGAGFEGDDTETRAAEALQQDAAGRAAADDEIVDFIRIAEAAHRDIDVLQAARACAGRSLTIRRAEQRLFTGSHP